MGRGEEREDGERLARLDGLRASFHNFFDGLHGALLRESMQPWSVCPQACREKEHWERAETGMTREVGSRIPVVNNNVDLGKRFCGVCNSGSRIGNEGWITDNPMRIGEHEE